MGEKYMTGIRKLATSTAAVLVVGAFFSTTPYAADAPVAQNTSTVWVDGKGQAGFADKVNKMHADMEAKGWKFGDMEIYVEDGDMKGAFVTYVR
jgi:hypothetical protein